MERHQILQAVKEGRLEDAVALLMEDDFGSRLPPETVNDIFSAATARGHTSVMRLLLDKGYDINGLDRNRQTPLYSACKRKNVENIGSIKFLLEKGARMDVRGKGKRTALAAACRQGRAEVVELLLQNGASLVERTSRGHTLLSLAAFSGHTHVIQLLLQHGASVEEAIEGGNTPLMLSAQCNQADSALVLLEAGAAVDRTNDKGQNALMIAAKHGHLRLVELLLPFCQRKSCVDAADVEGFNALMLATRKGDLEIVRRLFSLGLPTVTSTGVTVLMLAVEYNHKSVVIYLLSVGVRPTCSDHQGVTALHLSSQDGSYDITVALLNKGAEVNTYSSSGFTPLMLASSLDHERIVRLLIGHGAYLDSRRRGCVSALLLAVSQGHQNIVKILLKAGASITEGAKQLAEVFNHFSILETLKEMENSNSDQELASKASLDNSDTKTKDEGYSTSTLTKTESTIDARATVETNVYDKRLLLPELNEKKTSGGMKSIQEAFGESKNIDVSSPLNVGTLSETASSTSAVMDSCHDELLKSEQLKSVITDGATKKILTEDVFDQHARKSLAGSPDDGQWYKSRHKSEKCEASPLPRDEGLHRSLSESQVSVAEDTAAPRPSETPGLLDCAASAQSGERGGTKQTKAFASKPHIQPGSLKHTDSAPGDLQASRALEQIQPLLKDIQNPMHIHIHLDNRTYVSGARTVGLRNVNITNQPDDDDDDDDEEEKDGSDESSGAEGS